jgi:hypothetical protein
VFENFVTTAYGGLTGTGIEVSINFAVDMDMSVIDLSQWDLQIDGIAQGIPDSGQFWTLNVMGLNWTIPGLNLGMSFKVKYTGNDVNLKSESGVRQSGFDWKTVYA